MKMLLALGASLVMMSAVAIAGGGDSFTAEEAAPSGRPPVSLYDRIHARYAHYDRDVREEFRDGPCRIERHWERDGDFEERIRCRGPND